MSLRLFRLQKKHLFKNRLICLYICLIFLVLNNHSLWYSKDISWFWFHFIPFYNIFIYYISWLLLHGHGKPLNWTFYLLGMFTFPCRVLFTWVTLTQENEYLIWVVTVALPLKFVTQCWFQLLGLLLSSKTYCEDKIYLTIGFFLLSVHRIYSDLTNLGESKLILSKIEAKKKKKKNLPLGSSWISTSKPYFVSL